MAEDRNPDLDRAGNLDRSGDLDRAAREALTVQAPTEPSEEAGSTEESPEAGKTPKRKRAWIAVAAAALLVAVLGVVGFAGGAFDGLADGGLFNTVEAGSSEGAASQSAAPGKADSSQKIDSGSIDPDAAVSNGEGGSAGTSSDGSGAASSGGSAAASGDTASNPGSGASSGSSAGSGGSSASGGASGGSASSGGTTAPAPEPAPQPAPEPAPQPAPATVTVTVSVESGSVGNPVSWYTSVTLNQGATVYDALAASGIGFNAESSAYGIYISAIGGLAEKEHGSGSGWMYYVNGAYVPMACSACVLNDGDFIAWTYVTG